MSGPSGRKGFIPCPSGYGDVVDRVTILRIKVARLTDLQKRVHVEHELSVLESAWDAESLPEMREHPLYSRLAAVNSELWDVEDALREHEREGVFDLRFIGLARSVYRLNDERAELKRKINVDLGSRLIEQKSYG